MSPVKSNAPEVAALRGLLARSGGQASWRDLERVADSPQFRAFIHGRHPSLTPLLASPGRRRLLQIMAASFAFGGLAGKAKAGPVIGYDEIVPYVNQPTGLTPDVPLSYASATLLDGIANGVLVTTVDGRPIKIEGNPDHPWSRGGTDIFGQASVLGLYDPDRSQAVRHLDIISDWATFHAITLPHFTQLKSAGGKGFRILTGQVTSPTLIAQLQSLQKSMADMHWHSHAPIGREQMYAGAQQVFGKPVETRWRFDQAQMILSLDGDFLDPGPQQVGASRGWIDARRKSAKSGGLLTMHALAPEPSLTFAKADHHHLIAQRDLLPFAQALLADVTGNGAASGGPLPQQRQAIAKALHAAAGKSIVLTGTQQSPELHAVVHRLNAALGNTGKTVFYTEPVVAQTESFADLVAAMRKGEVDTLVMLDCNPVYTAPGDVEFAKLLSGVRTKIHAGLHEDETAVRCDWHLPMAHPLEAWGDARSLDGTATMIQPTIEPVADVRSVPEIVWLLTNPQQHHGYAILQDFWRSQMGKQDFDKSWHQALLAGFVQGSAFPAVNVTPSQNAAAAPVPAPAPGATAAPAAAPAAGSIEVVVRPDPTIWDGAFANNVWLQELPKPLTKTVWDNVITLPRKLASQHHLQNGDVVEIAAAGQHIAGPVWIVPAQNETTVVVRLGYGRRNVGSVGADIGYDAYPLRRLDALWHIDNAKLTRGKGAVTIAETQQLDTEEGHNYVRVQPLGGKPVGDDSAFNQPTLYKRAPSDGREWGMVIDLDACTGCGACVAACQAENNIPSVGKDQVLAGRDMHWLRVDRYYTGQGPEPDTRFMPVPCMMCEMAPCELGCPVEATVHDDEGLNLMIYNRCIGTRACNAYCPYKVRHFNYMLYSDAPLSIEAQRNPAVTVRARGVMEKCTYCVQRIVAARIVSDREHRPIRDGEVVTACAGACPTRAITFGDLKDKDSAVAAARFKNPGNYALLGELNTRPHTTYLPVLAPNDKEQKA